METWTQIGCDRGELLIPMMPMMPIVPLMRRDIDDDSGMLESADHL